MRQALVGLLVLLCAAFAADRDLAGRYAGEWKGGSAGGDIRFALDQGEGGVWKCELSFGMAGESVKTIMRQVKLQDGKIDLTYDFDLAGAVLRSHVTGDWNGSAFAGKYDTTVTADGSPVDQGTWTASRAK